VKRQILIVDDDSSFREVLKFNMEEEGFSVLTAENGKDGLLRFLQHRPPLVVTDMKMPVMDGMELLEKIRERAPLTLVIVITAFGDVDTAVKAMKKGAFDFIPKPCERDHFKLSVKKAFEHASLKNRVGELNRKLQGFDKKLIYKSREMERVVSLIDKVADSDATVLILGESGTGKELVAREIHKKSGRSEKPFVAVNCASIPKDLMESELFGHVKGAFTGAVADKKGKFELAEGGTIFLDEIGELPQSLQPRLLRVLQEKTVDAVGAENSVEIDVRILTATNRQLELEVENGAFREDLFYRINVFPVKIPPLRNRRDDILPLVMFFTEKYGGVNKFSIDESLKAKMRSYNWKGNVRELENMVQRMVLLAEGNKLTADLFPEINKGASSMLDENNITLPEMGISLVEVEKNIIKTALAMNDYNQSKTAEFLKIPRHVLLYRIEKFEIDLKGEN